MRPNILVAGGLFVAASIILISSEFFASILGFALGGLNVGVGLLTSRTVGISVPADQQGPLKFSLDKAVIRTNIYTIAFSEEKLVLRKLSSANLTVTTALLLALLGFVVAGPFGVIVGGITAFSLQEFATQRRRDGIMKGNLLDPSSSGDLEFSLNELDHIQIVGNRIQLYLRDRIVRIGISRKYSRMLGAMLEKIIPAKIQSESAPSPRAL